MKSGEMHFQCPFLSNEQSPSWEKKIVNLTLTPFNYLYLWSNISSWKLPPYQFRLFLSTSKAFREKKESSSWPPTEQWMEFNNKLSSFFQMALGKLWGQKAFSSCILDNQHYPVNLWWIIWHFLKRECQPLAILKSEFLCFSVETRDSALIESPITYSGRNQNLKYLHTFNQKLTDRAKFL